MKKSALWLSLSLLASCAPMQSVQTQAQWVPLDPQNLLVIDTTKGRMIVEMRPDLAPNAVQRIKLLAREGVYNGLQFHRVIDLFVVQTGNPNNKDGGTSTYPNLEAEFSVRLPDKTPWRQVTQTSDGNAGFLGTMPILTVSAKETQRRNVPNFQAWGAYCPGVAGMGRGEDVNSANSEIFFMRGASSFRLGLQYTAWGNAVIGREIITTVAAGEPPANPDMMQRVQVAADLPEGQRPNVEMMDTQSPAFAQLIAKVRREKGADFSICDVQVPTRLK
ncbi:peptidylprolyl isomerase [Deinococcus detaillensis]|uniref:peptidylprolyl isomerase n=1 Tax=Deinococcus detaillensis TaxID=2592048 RepID=A0A553UKP1_9DEIO|nr:peptidylprolyl isomerase [Deinococcus detaillensis]